MRRVAVRYGPHRANVAELWRPARAAGPYPVVVLVHGGYWRARHTKILMRRLARAVSDQGWAAWNIEYRRTGRFGGGGGWPTTFEDVAAAIDGLARVPGTDLDLDRVVTCGHSAGGHLALWAAARGRLGPDDPGADPKVQVAGAVSLAGVVDLVRGAELGLGDGAVPTLMGAGPERLPAAYAVASPAALLPLGVPQVLIHGDADQVVPHSMSADYVEAARRAGDTDAVLETLPGVGHMEVIAPRAPVWPVLRDHLGRLFAG